MRFFEQFITNIFEQTRFNTPTKLAKHMNVPRQRVNQFKHKGFRPTAEECLLVSNLLGLNFEQVHFTICLDRARNQEEAEIFTAMIKKYQKPINIPAKFRIDVNSNDDVN